MKGNFWTVTGDFLKHRDQRHSVLTQLWFLVTVQLLCPLCYQWNYNNNNKKGGGRDTAVRLHTESFWFRTTNVMVWRWLHAPSLPGHSSVTFPSSNLFGDKMAMKKRQTNQRTERFNSHHSVSVSRWCRLIRKVGRGACCHQIWQNTQKGKLLIFFLWGQDSAVCNFRKSCLFFFSFFFFFTRDKRTERERVILYKSKISNQSKALYQRYVLLDWFTSVSSPTNVPVINGAQG